MKLQNNIKLAKPYFENLDALRFIAAFAVFIFHFFQEIKHFLPNIQENKIYKMITVFTGKGTLGVNFFFVLSGFLITYLILFESSKTQHFNLKNFLIRRTLRIWPLYYLIVLLGFVVFPLILKGYNTVHSPLNYILFLANFDELRIGLADNVNFLTAPWSVAVEEQFYLFWGILLFLISAIKQQFLNSLIFIFILFSIGFSIWYFNDHRVLYYHTFSVMSNILTGAFLANAFFHKARWLLNIKQLKKTSIVLIYIIGIGMIVLKNKIFIGYFAAFEHLVLSLFFAFVIFEQIYLDHSFFKFGRLKLFTHLGRISYGLYLYHLVVFYVLTYLLTRSTYFNSHSILQVILFFVFGTGLTYLVSRLSYTYFEKPFLNLKKRFN